MKIYLAHNFAARDYLRDTVKPLLESRGHVVTSRWLWDDDHLLHTPEQDIKSACHDLEDVEKADYLIFFTNQFGDRPGRGKFVEFGYSLRAGKIVVLVGSRDDPGYAGCVFFRLPNLRHSQAIEEVLEFL